MLLEVSQTKRSKAISLTPLIDVVFILLLFFMLSSSFSRWFAIDLSMPSSSKTEQTETLRVRLLNNQGQLNFEGQRFQAEDQRFISVLQEKPGSVIVIDAQNKVSTQVIIQLIDRLKSQGLDKVSFGATFENVSKAS